MPAGSLRIDFSEDLRFRSGKAAKQENSRHLLHKHCRWDFKVHGLGSLKGKHLRKQKRATNYVVVLPPFRNDTDSTCFVSGWWLALHNFLWGLFPWEQGRHLFATEYAIYCCRWGDYVLDPPKYSQDLINLLDDMLDDQSNFRPSAAKVLLETNKGRRIDKPYH